MPQFIDLPYYPRTALLEGVLKVLTSGLKQGVTLFAPRRTGKTQFVVHELLPAAAEVHGWITVNVDLWARKSEPELALVEGIEAALASSRSKWPFTLKNVSGKAKAKAGVVEAEFGADFESSGTPDASDLEGRLGRALAQLLVKGPIVLLVVDECQALATGKREGFVHAFRTHLQKHRGKLVTFFTGSSQRGLNEMFREQHAPLFASTLSVDMAPFGREFVEDRALWLREQHGMKVDIDALDRAFSRLDHIPGFLSEIILMMMISGNADVETALSAWHSRQEQAGIGAELRKLSTLQSSVLRFLAIESTQRPFSAAGVATIQNIAGSLEPVTAARIQTAVKALEKKGFLASTGRGGYVIEDRGLLTFLRAG